MEIDLLVSEAMKKRKYATGVDEAKSFAKVRNKLRGEARSLRKAWKWEISCASARQSTPLNLHEFEGSVDMLKWEKSLRQRCDETSMIMGMSMMRLL